MPLNIAIYVLATLLANYTADWFIPFGPMQTALGTLVFGITFTQRDRIHESGRQYAYMAIGVALVMNTIMSFLLDVPLRIIGASFLAIALAEGTDTEIYQRLIQRSWPVKVLSSNAVSIPLDSILFTFMAFYGVLSQLELWQLIAGDTLVKFLIATALVIWKPRRLRSAQEA